MPRATCCARLWGHCSDQNCPHGAYVLVRGRGQIIINITNKKIT